MRSDRGEVVTRQPYGNVRLDHLLSLNFQSYYIYKEKNIFLF